MNWRNVWLISQREIRDQLRDRRMVLLQTMLPLVLYPAMGVLILQMSQFVHETATRVELVRAEALPVEPPLLATEGTKTQTPLLHPQPADAEPLPREPVPSPQPVPVPQSAADAPLKTRYFAEDLFDEPADAKLLEVRVLPPGAGPSVFLDLLPEDCDARLIIPPGFAQQLEAFYAALNSPVPPGQLPVVPAPQIFYRSGKDTSLATKRRLEDVLAHYAQAIARHQLEVAGVPRLAILPPFEADEEDLSLVTGRARASLWAKLFPFLFLVWALAGAFQPAVDLCAGEKERGTLETLLCSPASRVEIVWGKLVTVMCASGLSATMNLLSMAITGALLLSRVRDVEPPPATAVLWFIVALPAVTPLFSALSLALASFARSTAEGNYYLMPLFLLMLPLMLLPMLPDVELTVGTSLIPVSGLMLVLRRLIEVGPEGILPYAATVACVTLACAALAIRWAVEQFQREAILFREAERVEPWSIAQNFFRRRGATPSFVAAATLAAVLLLIRFWLSTMSPNLALPWYVWPVIVPQALMLALTLAGTWVSARDFRATLLLTVPRPTHVVVAGLLAVCLHPLVIALHNLIAWIYPLRPEIEGQLAELMTRLEALPWWAALGLLAVLPACVEELTFRGYLLSGFRNGTTALRGIVLSSVCFGVVHMLWQQSLLAAVVGLVLGIIAVRTGSIVPGIAYHVVHNALGMIVPTLLTAALLEQSPWLSWLVEIPGPGEIRYRTPVLLAATVLTFLLLGLLRGPVAVVETAKVSDESAAK